LLKLKFNLGGQIHNAASNMVAKMSQNSFDKNIWKKAGHLLSRRTGHRSIVLGNKIFHIGGYGTQ